MTDIYKLIERGDWSAVAEIVRQETVFEPELLRRLVEKLSANVHKADFATLTRQRVGRRLLLRSFLGATTLGITGAVAAKKEGDISQDFSDNRSNLEAMRDIAGTLLRSVTDSKSNGPAIAGILGGAGIGALSMIHARNDREENREPYINALIEVARIVDNALKTPSPDSGPARLA